MSDLEAILIIEVEEDTEPQRMLEAWSQLVKSGTWKSLQGSYQRGVLKLIEDGWLDKEGNILKPLKEEV